MSDNYLFDVLKVNHHYCGKKPIMKKEMSSLNVDYPDIFHINTKTIRKNRIKYYYLSPNGIIPDASNLSQCDWESTYEYKRVTRAVTSNESAPAITEHHELSQCAMSKYCGNKYLNALKTSVPNFMKNYASLIKLTVDSKESMSIKASLLKASIFVTVAPSPEKDLIPKRLINREILLFMLQIFHNSVLMKCLKMILKA